MLNDDPIHPIDAIRHGFDDRLLAFVEYDPDAATTIGTAADHLHAWRARFEDELEIAALVRIGSDSAQDGASSVERQCAAVRALATRNLPVAVGVTRCAHSWRDTSQIRNGPPTSVEQWAACDSEVLSLLTAIRLPADLLLCRVEHSHERRTERRHLFLAPERTTSQQEQSAFIAYFAQRVALRENTALGIVLAPFGATEMSASAEGTRLLASLADAVYRRRIRCAA